MQGRLRATDVVARIGGDEFAVMLPVADPGHFGPGAWASGEALLEIADRAMYAVKAQATS